MCLYTSPGTNVLLLLSIILWVYASISFFHFTLCLIHAHCMWHKHYRKKNKKKRALIWCSIPLSDTNESVRLTRRRSVRIGTLYFNAEKLKEWMAQGHQTMALFEKIRTVGKGGLSDWSNIGSIRVLSYFNPLTSISHWSGFKVKLTFHGTQFFGSSLYTGQILGILCLQIDLFLIVECQFRPCISRKTLMLVAP